MQNVDVGFTHVAFTVRCLASSIDFYTRYTAMTVIHQREPDLPSARKVAWLSDRTRPFALVLVQSDDPADTPLGPFGHLGVACATQADWKSSPRGAPANPSRAEYFPPPRR